MLQLIYRSVATVPFYNAELSRLLMKARVQNDILEVTGMLVFHSNAFLQVIEGEEDAVNEVFQQISTDPRHKGIQVLRKEKIEQRSFPDWSLGFIVLYNEIADVAPGAADFFNSKGSFGKAVGEQALEMLKAFRTNPLRRRVDLGYSPLIIRSSPRMALNTSGGVPAIAGAH